MYHALLDAGVNWYEASCQLETILESGNIIDIQITPVTGGELSTVSIVLDGLEKRPPRTTRLRITVDLTSVNRVRIHIEDLGFGEIFKALDKSWTQEFNI